MNSLHTTQLSLLNLQIMVIRQSSRMANLFHNLSFVISVEQNPCVAHGLGACFTKKKKNKLAWFWGSGVSYNHGSAACMQEVCIWEADNR